MDDFLKAGSSFGDGEGMLGLEDGLGGRTQPPPLPWGWVVAWPREEPSSLAVNCCTEGVILLVPTLSMYLARRSQEMFPKHRLISITWKLGP